MNQVVKCNLVTLDEDQPMSTALILKAIRAVI